MAAKATSPSSGSQTPPESSTCRQILWEEQAVHNEPGECFLLEKISLEIRFIIYDHIIHDRTIYKSIPATIRQADQCKNNPRQKQARRIKINKWRPCSERRMKKNYFANTLNILSQTRVQHRQEIEIWYKAKPWLRQSPGLGIFDPQTTEFYLLLLNSDPLTKDSKLEQRLSNFFSNEVHRTEMRHLRIDLDMGDDEDPYANDESRSTFINRMLSLSTTLETALVPYDKDDLPNGPYGVTLLRNGYKKTKRYPIKRFGCLDSFDLNVVESNYNHARARGGRRRKIRRLSSWGSPPTIKIPIQEGKSHFSPVNESDDQSEDESD